MLASDSDTYVTNELGLNVSMTDTLALRTSILTEYRSNPQPGFVSTDNTLGVSVVYTFNYARTRPDLAGFGPINDTDQSETDLVSR